MMAMINFIKEDQLCHQFQLSVPERHCLLAVEAFDHRPRPQSFCLFLSSSTLPSGNSQIQARHHTVWGVVKVTLKMGGLMLEMTKSVVHLVPKITSNQQ